MLFNENSLINPLLLARSGSGWKSNEKVPDPAGQKWSIPGFHGKSLILCYFTSCEQGRISIANNTNIDTLLAARMNEDESIQPPKEGEQAGLQTFI